MSGYSDYFGKIVKDSKSVNIPEVEIKECKDDRVSDPSDQVLISEFKNLAEKKSPSAMNAFILKDAYTESGVDYLSPVQYSFYKFPGPVGVVMVGIGSANKGTGLSIWRFDGDTKYHEAFFYYIDSSYDSVRNKFKDYYNELLSISSSPKEPSFPDVRFGRNFFFRDKDFSSRSHEVK